YPISPSGGGRLAEPGACDADRSGFRIGLRSSPAHHRAGYRRQGIGGNASPHLSRNQGARSGRSPAPDGRAPRHGPAGASRRGAGRERAAPKTSEAAVRLPALSLAGRSAGVVGGTSGIRLALSRRLAAAGGGGVSASARPGP